jgi:hypothetical protein
MEKIFDTAGKIFTNNHRFIKQDGSGYFSGRAKSAFEKASFNSMVLMAVCLAGFEALSSGDLSNWAHPFTSSLMGSTFSIAILTILDNTISDKINKRSILRSKQNNAIDTQGNSLKPAQLSLLEIRTLKFNRVGKISSTFAVAGILESSVRISTGDSFLISNPGAIIVAFWTGEALSETYRSHKLYKGHTGQKNGYVFCEEPPKEIETSKASIFSNILGGVRSPSI